MIRRVVSSPPARPCVGARRALALLAAIAAAATPAAAQTDYYNTDARRPVQVEDAFPVERHAFEAQVAPLRLERSDGGAYHWELEPELAYGVLPHMQLEVGLPLVFRDGADARGRFGVAGVEVSALYNLNAETLRLPALAVAAGAVLPIGGFAPDRPYPSVKGIATRTFSFARFHLNGEYTFGRAPAEGPVPAEGGAPGEVSRWMAGVAVDRTFVLQSMLVIADLLAEQPLHDDEPIEWTVEAGVRYQLDPYFALDGGLGRTLTGEERGWFVTFGAARAFAIRSLIPVARR